MLRSIAFRAAQSTSEEVALVFSTANGNAVSIADVDEERAARCKSR